MSKILEVWKRVRESAENADGDAAVYEIGDCDIIEQELKDGARYKQALEIIKRTRLNVGKFMILCKGDHEYTPNTTYEQYVYFCEHEDDIGGDKMHSFPCYRMTKEEYELVLGVLYGKETS